VRVPKHPRDLLAHCDDGILRATQIVERGQRSAT